MWTWFLLVAVATLCSCSQPAPKLTIAAAANLSEVFGEVGEAFQAKSGVSVVVSFGSTAQLSKQIENGAPFDLFAAADTEHIDRLITANKLTAESRAVYASGQLALWAPAGGIGELKDLADRKVHFIAIAQPDSAPYGKASIEALQHFQLWDILQPKVVYANSISQAKQLAASGNAEVALTAYSLVFREKGTVLKIDSASYHPLDQALAIAKSTAHREQANQFRTFLLGAGGRSILAKNGYRLP